MGGKGGMGVKLYLKNGATYDEIPGLTDIDFPEQEKVLEEATPHNASGGYAEFVATGKREVKEFTATLLFDPDDTVHAALVTAFGSLTPSGFKLTNSDASEGWTFDGHVKGFKRESKQDGAYKAEVTIQPTGTLTALP